MQSEVCEWRGHSQADGWNQEDEEGGLSPSEKVVAVVGEGRSEVVAPLQGSQQGSVHRCCCFKGRAWGPITAALQWYTYTQAHTIHTRTHDKRTHTHTRPHRLNSAE